MSAFLQSGRSDHSKIKKMKDGKRPEADVGADKRAPGNGATKPTYIVSKVAMEDRFDKPAHCWSLPLAQQSLHTAHHPHPRRIRLSFHQVLFCH